MAFIPISDDPGPRRRLPIVNFTLILINVAVFVVEVVKGSCFQAAYSVIPTAIEHGQSYAFQGCSYAEPSPVYLTLITAMFLHANIVHIGGNMLYLFIFGDNVEDWFGHIPYLLFYLVCGVVASLTQVLVNAGSTVPELGASGAIAGVLGAYLIFYPGSRVRTIVFLGIFFTLARLPALLVIGVWIILQFIGGVQSLQASGQGGGVAYFAHIGGFITGLLIALLARPLARKPRVATQSYPYWPAHPDLRRN